MSVIFVNFAEKNKHGCDRHCPFCEWSKKNYNIYYYPTDLELNMLYEFNPTVIKWQISGGGDPLYHYTINRDKLKHIADYAHNHDIKIELLTHKINTALLFINELKQYIDLFSFSVLDIPTNNFKELASLLDNQLEVNVVLNELDWQRINLVYQNYQNYCKRIKFRENFLHPLTEEERESILQAFKENYPKAKFSFNVNKYVLFNGEILTCQEIDNKYLK